MKFEKPLTPQSSLQAAQARALGNVSAVLAELFDHFAVAIIPGGGGERLRSPQWTFNGNRALLVGVVEQMKLHIAGAVVGMEKKIVRKRDDVE